MKQLSAETIAIGTQHITDILQDAIRHTPLQRAVVIFDTQCALSQALTECYRRCLPEAIFIDFYSVTPEAIHAVFNTLNPLDLVVLIQSTSFRLDAFRLRVELFKQSLKVIEHPHLIRMKDAIEEIYYINALAYDKDYYRNTGHALKKIIDSANSAIIDSGGEKLIYSSRFESAKLNIGDYREMKNIGGQFPIGEVFTEAQDLETVNGRVRIFIFADITFSTNKPEKPITLVISRGRVVEVIDSTPEFEKVLEKIRADEGEVWLRELGFGLNRAFSPERVVTDVGTYERMCGIHLSLGAKHAVYKKPNLKGNNTWHHVDVFAVTDSVMLDNQIVFEKGKWKLPPTV